MPAGCHEILERRNVIEETASGAQGAWARGVLARVAGPADEGSVRPAPGPDRQAACGAAAELTQVGTRVWEASFTPGVPADEEAGGDPCPAFHGEGSAVSVAASRREIALPVSAIEAVEGTRGESTRHVVPSRAWGQPGLSPP